MVLVAGAAILLRQPAGAAAVGSAAASGALLHSTVLEPTVRVSPASGHSALLSALKEELFSLESDKIAGKINPQQYAEVKAALEVVLKRALNRNPG